MILDCIEKSLRGNQLTGEEASAALDSILSGLASETQTLALLVAMSMNGVGEEALAAMALALRRHFKLDDVPSLSTPDVIVSGLTSETALSDINNQSAMASSPTYNFETALAASFVMAGSGIKVLYVMPVSDVTGDATRSQLKQINVWSEDSVLALQSSVNDYGLDFLDAQLIGSLSERIDFARRHLPMPTILDLLLPIACSGKRSSTLIDVGRIVDGEIVGRSLIRMGVERAAIFTSGATDDAPTVPTSTTLWAIKSRAVGRHEINIDTFGLASPRSSEIPVSDTNNSAALLKSVFAGELSVYRNATIIYAAAGIVACGKAENLSEGIRVASESIDTGRAQGVLAQISASNKRS